MITLNKHFWFATIILLLMLVTPLTLYGIGKDYMGLATKLVCLSIAAVSLNLILGYGGMVSFGHAVFIGIGAYAVGIPSYHAIYGELDWLASDNGFFHLAIAVGLSALFALVTGAISLRTRGIHFIMITMAFSQMVFYLLISLETYGGDDGLTIDQRSQVPTLSFDNPIHMFLTAFVVLVAAVALVTIISNSRFGMVLKGAKDNEARMRAMGFNTFAYQLTAYVIAGTMCGIAGALWANSEAFVFPEMIDWTRSGELIFMVLLGGGGTPAGPLVGAVIFVVLEEVLSSWTIYWHLPFGIMLILSVLFARTGLYGFIIDRIGRKGSVQ